MANSSNNLYGFPQPLTRVFPPPVLSQRAPASTDFAYPIGQLWVDEAIGDYYGLVSVVANSASWVTFGTDNGPLNTLTGDSGGALAPSAGNITIAGTANQITSIGSGSTITLSLIGPYTPATYTSHGVLVGAGTSSIAALAVGATNSVLQGSTGANPAFTTTPTVATLTTTGLLTGGNGITATTGNIVATAGNITTTAGSITSATTLTATLGAITATNGNLVLGTAGNKLVISAGSSATCSAGTFVLGGGATTVVSNSAVTASSLILLTTQALGTVVVASTLAVTAKSAGVSFTVTPSVSSDTSTIAYLIIN